MMKRTRLIVFLVAVSMMIASMFSGMPVSAASGADTETITSDAELAAAKKCTIKKKNGKRYYVNSKGKVDKTAGWKKDVKGKYTYYVGEKGYVRYQIKNGNLYKWKNSRWKKVSLKKYKKDVIKVGGKCFYVNSKGTLKRTSGWYNLKKTDNDDYRLQKYPHSYKCMDSYYVNKNGCVEYKIKMVVYSTSQPNLYKWKNGKWKKVSLKAESKKVIGDKEICTDENGLIGAIWDYEPPEHPPTEEELNAQAYEVMDLINEERAKAGLSPANKADDVLMQVAKIRAKQISKSFAHDVDEEKLLYEINPDYYYHYGYCGEIIATSDSPERAVTQWMESKGHRHFILQEGDNENPDDFYVSAGVYYDTESNCYYYAVIFWHYHEYTASEDV